MSNQQKVAFITGGAIGFGRAFAKALAAKGVRLALADIDLNSAEQTAKQLCEEGFQAIAVECDVADPESVNAAVKTTIDAYGGVDILINNAGKHLTKYNMPFSTLTHEDVRTLFDVNVHGIINCTLACKESLSERNGAIVNISSIAGYLSSTPYGVSKLAVRGLTIALAHELSPSIRVNAIAPGLIGTDSALADLPKEMVDDFTQNQQLIKRLGEEKDIVEAMLYLCSEQSSFLTGETIKVSGGYPLGI